MIRTAGRLEQEIVIRFTGLWPGKKRCEELIPDSDKMLPTKIVRLRIAKLEEAAAHLGLLAWVQLSEPARQRDEVVMSLADFVPEYRHLNELPKP